jgi:general secretion pathway protein G
MQTVIRTKSRKGFTLVEILIVVIILGILAAIVIPQFTNASEDARKGNMKSQLQTLRSQIELFKLQHRDSPPPLTDFWKYLTQYTTDDITVAPDLTASTAALTKYGPYMQAAAENPLTKSSTLALAAAPGVGWEYHETTGEIHGVAKDGTKSDDGESSAVVP